MLYNSTLTLDSYNEFNEHLEIEKLVENNINFRYEHEHRKWEYGLALRFSREVLPNTILNVGGGNSPLSTILLGVSSVNSVVEVDPEGPGVRLPNIEYLVESFPLSTRKKYDLVVCTSVIEHIEFDESFFDELLDSSLLALFLTTDFHPSGKAFSINHYRTYNKEKMLYFINRAEKFGFSPYGDFNYTYLEPMVYDYTFAALALRRCL